MNLSPSELVVISPHQVSCRVGEDVVVLGLSESAYFGLKGVGTFLWELIQNPITVQDLQARVTAEYEVEPEEAERDIQRFLTDLWEAKLIEVRRPDAA